MSKYKPGQWILFRRSVAHDALSVAIAMVTRVDRLTLAVEWGRNDSVTNIVRQRDVLAAFAKERDALAAAKRIAAVREVRDAKLLAVHDAATLAVRKLQEGWGYL